MKFKVRFACDNNNNNNNDGDDGGGGDDDDDDDDEEAIMFNEKITQIDNLTPSLSSICLTLFI